MRYGDELNGLEGEKKTKRLSELNVLRSMEVLKTNPSIIEAVKGRGLKVHGVIYDLASGKLETLDDKEDEKGFKARLEAFDMLF